MDKISLSTIFVVLISALLNDISDAGCFEAELFKTCNANVSSKEPIFVSYKIQNCSYKEKFLRIKFETKLNHNQTISIKSEFDGSKLKLENKYNESIVSTKKTMCSNSQMKSCEENEVFLLKVESNSPESILVNFTGDLIDYVKMNIGENLSITINDHNSTFVLLKFNDANKDMKLIIKSEDDQCMIAFIEKTGCSSNTSNKNVRNKTITRKGSIPIKNYGKFKDNSLFVVFMLKDNKTCKQHSENQTVSNGKQFKQKNINITFVNVITNYSAVSKLVGVYTGCGIAYVFLYICWNYYYGKKGDNGNPSINLIAEDSENTIESTKNHGKWYNYWCLGKYYLFCNTIFTISVFCILPIIGLLWNFFTIMNEHWNYDNCYFNDYCSKPLGSFVAFNNIISNIGFIFLGVIFICVIKSRSYMDKYSNNGIFYALGFSLIMEGIMSASYHICPRFNIIHLEKIYMIIIGCLLNLYCAIQMLQIFYENKIKINKYTKDYFFFMSFVLLTIFILMIFENKTLWIAIGVFHAIFILIIADNIFNLHNAKLCSSLKLGKSCALLLVLINIILFISGFLLKIGFYSYFLAVLFVNFEILLVMYYAIILRNEVQNTNQNPFRAFIGLILNNKFILVNFLGSVILWALTHQSFNFAAYMGNFEILFVVFFAIVIIKKTENTKIGFKDICLICILLIIFLGSIILWMILAYQSFKETNTNWMASNQYDRDCTLWNFYDIHDEYHIFSSFAIFLTFMWILMIDGVISNKNENT